MTAGYGQQPVISDISLRSQTGSIVSILGPNGSGKSTLLKAIVGILKPTAGHVLLGTKELTGWPAHRVVREGIGYVPQGNNVFPSLTVVENLEMGAFTLKGDTAARVEEVLDIFPDLKASRKKRAFELSVGQRNLMGLARALMAAPSVILVDEPTAGVAPANTKRIWHQLETIAANGAGVIVVEQNVDMAINHSQWCYVLVAGRSRLDGPAESIRHENLHDLFLGGVH